MNTRSLKFQLIVWYASLLAGGFVLLGAAAYVALERYLVGALKESQLRRARQIAQLAREESKKSLLSNVGSEIEARYAPGLNDRFVRVSRENGEVLYLSIRCRKPHLFSGPLYRHPFGLPARRPCGELRSATVARCYSRATL